LCKRTCCLSYFVPGLYIFVETNFWNHIKEGKVIPNFVVDPRNFEVDVDVVEEGAADAFLVAGNGGGGATAFFDGIT